MSILPTGHAEIDQQHAILECMVEELARLCTAGTCDPAAACDRCSVGQRQRCNAALASITGELLAFLVGHATYEERLMELLPPTDSCVAHVKAHKAAHGGIAKRLNRIAQQIGTTCPRQLAALLAEIAREWIGDHGVLFDATLVRQLKRVKKTEIEFDGELVAILDEHVFHNRPTGTKRSPAATESRERKRLEVRGRFELLSPAQREVFWLVVKGLKNSEIASRLGVSINTVKTHRAAVFQKMEVRSVLDLAKKTEVLHDSLHK